MIFDKTPIICDDESWVWHFIQECLQDNKISYIKLPSATSMRQGWQSFKAMDRIIIHWEGKTRPGGALVEEILEINPRFDVAQHVIVLTTNPVHEDVVYFTELGIKRVIKLRHREEDLQNSATEFKRHLFEDFSTNPSEIVWNKIQRALDFMPRKNNSERLKKLKLVIGHQKSTLKKPSSRLLDVMASVASLENRPLEAEKLWLEALKINPNYFRAYNNLVKHYKQVSDPESALTILQRMHQVNKARISRQVDFGDIYLSLQKDQKAIQHYSKALEKDHFCSRALSGLADIRFRQNDLDQTKELLSRTTTSHSFASRLNLAGIDLVNGRRYQEALEHYTKAQYVLPQNEKGPMLFFNIGLCYFRWNKPEMAQQFIQISLVKEPNYKKAKDLLKKIEDRLGQAA